jgi:hypothetical protein
MWYQFLTFNAKRVPDSLPQLVETVQIIITPVLGQEDSEHSLQCIGGGCTPPYAHRVGTSSQGYQWLGRLEK